MHDEFYKQFCALPFKIHTLNPLRRITRKSAVADELNCFPPEGHVCLPININNYTYFFFLVVQGEGKRALGICPTNCVEYHLLLMTMI